MNDKPATASLEGYIYPDTYRIYTGDSLNVLIQKAIDELGQVAAANDLRAQFAARGLSFYQGVTLASIIIKEVGNADDQEKVASVFYNRLAAGMPLGSDPTFQYAYNQGLCNSNSTNCDSAYNTYLNTGLPPGPIANPNLSALQAVANPADTPYLFFVSGDDGTTYFATTQEEQDTNISLYCHQLCQ